MSTQTSFEKFIQARAAYRAGIVSRKFKSYAAVVTDHDTAAFVTALGDKPTPQSQAVSQQAIDMLSASQRAIDMRGTTHMDHIRNYDRSATFQDVVEAVRLERFKSGRY